MTGVLAEDDRLAETIAMMLEKARGDAAQGLGAGKYRSGTFVENPQPFFTGAG